MKLISYSAIAATLLVFSGCKKELSLELPNSPVIIGKDEQFKNAILERRVQLKAFYSDIPIDYIENDDTVKQETNLWPYVSEHLKDDYTTFKTNGTDLMIEQNAVKVPGNDSAVLHRNYYVAKDDLGIYMNFLDYQYRPLRYEINQVGDGYFILSIKWKQGATLFSRFEVIP